MSIKSIDNQLPGVPLRCQLAGGFGLGPGHFRNRQNVMVKLPNQNLRCAEKTEKKKKTVKSKGKLTC